MLRILAVIGDDELQILERLDLVRPGGVRLSRKQMLLHGVEHLPTRCFVELGRRAGFGPCRPWEKSRRRPACHL